MDLGRLVADAPVLGRMRRELRQRGWGPADFGAFVARTGWDELLPKLPRERILLLAADTDRFFAPEVVTAMWSRWGARCAAFASSSMPRRRRSSGPDAHRSARGASPGTAGSGLRRRCGVVGQPSRPQGRPVAHASARGTRMQPWG
jgi:hypothetical protein